MSHLLTLFSQAAMYRGLSLLFQPPQDLAAQLSEVTGCVPEEYRERFESLVGMIHPELSFEYHRVLGASGVCRDCESDYQENPLGGKGPLLVDIAAFYQAFSYHPQEFKAAQDHISIELGFLGYLALKQAYAQHNGLTDEVHLCEDAANNFTRDHLARWVKEFLLRLSSAAAVGFYSEAALLCAEILEPLLPELPAPKERGTNLFQA